MKAIKILKAFTNAMFMTKDDILKVNEAIKELEELENRSCSNCEHYKQSSHHVYKTCFLIKTNGFNLESNIDFYCNKWERKALNKGIK